MTPSIALAAVCPVLVFCDDADATAISARSAGPAPVTVTVTSAGLLLLCPSPTTSWNVSAPALAGAVNFGCTTVALDKVTAAPPVWVHWYVSGNPCGSKLPDPSSITVTPVFTVWSGPALATGAAPAADTVYSRSSHAA